MSDSSHHRRIRSGIDRLAQPLYNEFDVLRLQVAPALHLGLVAVLREAPKVFRRKLSGSHTLPSEFLADEWVFGHRADRRRVRLCSKVYRRGSHLRVGRNLWWSDLSCLARPEYQFTEGVFYWRAVFILSVFEMEYRGKHYMTGQGVEPSTWSLLDHRIATILQIRAVLAVRMFE
jgi:hypothetical protein